MAKVMTKSSGSWAEWALRLGVFGEFLGHGMFAIEGQKEWISWIVKLLGVNIGVATQILFLIGIVDVLLAVLVLIKPVRPILLWMALWGFWTAILRPIVGKEVWDFFERWANWGAPLALFFFLGRK